MASEEYMDEVMTGKEDFVVEYDSDDQKKKKKSARQIRHEEDLKRRGKWKEPQERYNANNRFVKYPNSDIVYQSWYMRGPKPWDGQHEVLVTHIGESAREVYLQNFQNEEITVNIAKQLATLYEGKEVPSLPYNLRTVNTACVFKYNGTWYRCRIFEVIRGLGFVLHLVDVGKCIRCFVEQFPQVKILLAADYIDAPEQAIHSKIAVICEDVQYVVEMELLKEMLPVGTRILATFDRKNNITPFRVHLAYGENKVKFHDAFENELRNRGIRSVYLKRLRQIEEWQASQPVVPPPPPPVRDEAADIPWEFARRMAAKDDARDRDPNASLDELTEEQTALVKCWIDSDQIYPDENRSVGLIYDQVKSQEESREWLEESDSESSDDESLSDSPLAIHSDGADVVVYK